MNVFGFPGVLWQESWLVPVSLSEIGSATVFVPLFGPTLAGTTNDPLNVGDRVVIEETRPLSKRKRWNVKEVIEKAS